ncbi:MAG: protein CicA [Ignavibacterium sp.]|nr:MAG: protein CicA [Ignavibacterium sp.]
MNLLAFDFDKTVTISDTILPLCSYFSRQIKSSNTFFIIQIYYIIYRFGLISSKRFKEITIKHLLKNKSTEEIENLVTEFYSLNFRKLFNPEIFNLINEQHNSGNKIIIVTSNLDLFIKPVMKLLPVDEVFGTRVKVTNGNVVGIIEGENCSGNLKVEAIKKYTSKFRFDKIISYGDSPGDFEMFKFSDESFIAQYKFDSFISKLACRIKYLCGRICSDGFKVTFRNFNHLNQ